MNKIAFRVLAGLVTAVVVFFGMFSEAQHVHNGQDLLIPILILSGYTGLYIGTASSRFR